MKSFWRKASVKKYHEIIEGSSTYFTYLLVIGGLVLIALSVRNLYWSRRFARGDCPLRTKDPRRVLEGFKKAHIAGFLLVASVTMLATGTLFFVLSLSLSSEDFLLEGLPVAFYLFSLSPFLSSSHRYFVGLISHMGRLTKPIGEMS
jgi:hypothetical protein